MSRDFRRTGDRVACRLRPYEVEILRGLVGDVRRLIAADAPANDVTRRLFPDPSFDPGVAEDLRGMIEDDLRAGKDEAARTLLESLPDDGRVALTDDEAQAWLTALNDVRLALGTAIGVTEEDVERDDPDFHVYHWLSFLQETLVEALGDPGVRR